MTINVRAKMFYTMCDFYDTALTANNEDFFYAIQ